MLVNCITLLFFFSALLGSPVDALEKPLSYSLRKTNSISNNKKNNVAGPALRNLQKDSLDSSFVAKYHNKGLEHVMKNKEALSSFPVLIEEIFLFLEKDEGFPDFDSKEAMTIVERTFIVSRDGIADAEASLYQALKEGAATSPAVAAIIDVMEQIKAEKVSSVDEAVKVVQTAAEKSGDSVDLMVSDVFGAVATASNEFWTAFLEPSEAGADGVRRALRRCRWWQKILIAIADAAGAAAGAIAGMAAGGPVLAAIFAVIFAIAFSATTKQNLGCD